MLKATINFVKCIQDSQEYGSNDEFMVSRVFFDLKTPNNLYKNLSADIKQTAGGNFESDPIEVLLPNDYQGRLNYQQFRDAVESYYRTLVGKNARAINIQGGSNIRLKNNTFIVPVSYEIEINVDEGGW